MKAKEHKNLPWSEIRRIGAKAVAAIDGFSKDELHETLMRNGYGHDPLFMLRGKAKTERKRGKARFRQERLWGVTAHKAAKNAAIKELMQR